MRSIPQLGMARRPAIRASQRDLQLVRRTPVGAQKKLPERPRPRGAKDTVLFRERLDETGNRGGDARRGASWPIASGLAVSEAHRHCIRAWRSNASWSAGASVAQSPQMQTRPRGSCVRMATPPELKAAVIFVRVGGSVGAIRFRVKGEFSARHPRRTRRKGEKAPRAACRPLSGGSPPRSGRAAGSCRPWFAGGRSRRPRADAG